MKRTKVSYTAIVLLVLFVCTFSVQNISALTRNYGIDFSFSQKDLKLIHSATDEVNASSEDPFENETEDGFEIQEFILPILFNYYQFELSQPKLISTSSLSDKLSNPIYISIHNFRV